jgi:hypothetical protein
MSRFKTVFWVSVCLALLVPQWAGQAQPAGPRTIDDVETAFARIQERGEHLTARVNGLIPKPRYRTSARNWFGLLNHFQGIQRLSGGYLALSGSNPRSSAAELFVVRVAGSEGDVVARVALDSAMWHAGGLGMLGNVLVVPLHGATPRHAKVVFYDVSNPETLVKLPVEIDRPGRKASAVACTELPNGHLIVAVLSAFDGEPRRLDFYLSKSTKLEDGFVTEPVSWRVSEVQARAGQEKEFPYFQGISFVPQSDGRLYLVGFNNSFASPSFLPGRDYADLFEVVFPGNTIDAMPPRLESVIVTKIATRILRCTDGYCNMDAAAGLFVDANTQSLSVYAAPGWLDGDIVKATVYRSAPAQK